MTEKRTATKAILSILTAAALAACGNLTAGGLTGKATVVVSGDADTLSSVPAPAPQRLVTADAPSLVAPAGPALVEPSEVEGELQVEFMAYLVDDAGEAIQLGDELQAQVDLKGRVESDVVDRQTIPATHYSELRVIFTKIHAEVEGLVVGGVPVPEVDVELEQLSLLVSRPLDLEVQQNAEAVLVVDLNSLAWLDAVDPNTGAVNETVFEELVNVVIR